MPSIARESRSAATRAPIQPGQPLKRGQGLGASDLTPPSTLANWQARVVELPSGSQFGDADTESAAFEAFQHIVETAGWFAP
jgi:hypothetical protein